MDNSQKPHQQALVNQLNNMQLSNQEKEKTQSTENAFNAIQNFKGNSLSELKEIVLDGNQNIKAVLKNSFLDEEQKVWSYV